MIYLFFLLLLCGVKALTPEECDQVQGIEREYICKYGEGTVTFAGKNDYVKINCEVENITCADLPRLDFGSGLRLKSLGISSCPPSILQCIYDVVNTTAVEHLTITQMTFPLEEEDVKNLGDVKMLIILEAGVQKSLPIAAINSLHNLRNLRIGGADFQLLPNIFAHAPPLVYLELRSNNIRSIPVDSFTGLSSLKELNIWGNNINNITIGAFNGLDQLQVLTLNTNKLKYIEPGSFATASNLKYLQLTANELKSLPNGLFNGLEQLESITIFMNRVDMELDERTFNNLPKLKKVDIKNCGIHVLPRNLFYNSTNLEILELSNNIIDNLPSGLLVNITSLKYIDLSNNKIVNFEANRSPFIGLNKLEYLNMNRNLIEKLDEGLFSSQSILKELYIDHNLISSIAWTSFQGASSLNTLSLATNKLTLEPSNDMYQFFPYTSPLHHLTNLSKLNLSHNNIRTIFDDWRLVMSRLEYLDLRWNKIKELDPLQIHFLGENITVDLRYNSIYNVSLIPTQESSENLPNPTQFLLLDGNPLICDCFLYELKLRADGSTPKGELKIVLDNAKCSFPPNLKGELVQQVSKHSLVCQLPDGDCPQNCNCTAKVATSELLIDCIKLPAELPNMKSDNISLYFTQIPTITMNLKHQPKSIDNYNIHTLNLSNTNLDNIEFKPSESLKILDVSQNKLTTVPIDFMKSNTTLYLANNLFECDCSSANSIAILKKYSFVPDFNQITCSNGEYVSVIDVTSLCKSVKAVVTAVVTFLILLFLASVSAILIYRYYNEIMLYLATKCCNGCIQIIKDDSEKDYDVFISFAHQDFNFVEDILLPKLEKDYNQKVCVHYRDWIIGDMIPAQILRSVENSRKTIIVMSKSFMESVWANLEFSAAHNLALKEQSSRVILILLDENITKHEKISPELRAYINTNTYLVRNDPKFWDRLHAALPSIEHRFRFFEALKQRDKVEKPVKNGLNVRLNSEGKLVNLGANNSELVKDLPEYV